VDYGLYVARSQDPIFTGTAGECRAQVDTLTDEQKTSGWTIGPIQDVPPPLPSDPNFALRLTLTSAVIVGVPALLALGLYLKGCK